MPFNGINLENGILNSRGKSAY